jgi:hypothetical protein
MGKTLSDIAQISMKYQGVELQGELSLVSAANEIARGNYKKPSSGPAPAYVAPKMDLFKEYHTLQEIMG